MSSNKKRIIIIGSNGMLGQRASEFFNSNENFDLFCASFEKESHLLDLNYRSIDLTDQNNIIGVLQSIKPEIIINAAAYTAVDKAEDEKDLCFKVNVAGPEILAEYSKNNDVHLIHISTDYVFDGENGPYTETDSVNPVGYYGLTKLQGEEKLIQSNCKYSIIRTNVLYGPAKFGRMDFVKWVVSSLKEEKEIKIVTDQINNPTYIDDLVEIICKLINTGNTGVFNSGGEEFLSRFEFTKKIASFFKLNESLIKPVLTKEFNQKAKRPLKSGLILEKTKKMLNFKPRSFEEAFTLMKEELNL